jgi:hypothetical protein
MIGPDRPRSPVTNAVERWRHFWFRPEPAYTLGLVRIAFGVLATAWALSLLPNLNDFFGRDGVVPPGRLPDYQWSLLEVWTSDRAILISWIVLMVSGIALTVGWHSRIAAALVFVLIMSLCRRDFMVLNSGDVLVRIEAFLLAISPCGTALSLDQRRGTGSFWSAQTRPRWPIRLMQVQLSLIYLSTVQAKLSGDTWREGTAVSYALRYEDMLLMPIPDWLRTNALLTNVATWATLVLEIMIGILVWNRRLRPWVLAAGVVMHTMIMATIAVGFFSLAMFVLYLAFIQPDTVRRWTDKVKGVAMQRRCRRPPTADPKRTAHTEVSHTPSPPADDERTGQGPKQRTKVLTGRLESARRVKSTRFGRRNGSTSADASTNKIRAGISTRT